MGKITEALKKIEKQREIQKLAWKNKKKEVIKPKEISSVKPSDGQEQVPHRLSPEEKLKVWEERIKTLRDRFKNSVYIAKATDDSGIDPRVVTYFNPTAPISEQYRILRTNIQSKSLSKSAKIFLISSAMHGEGKTVTAVNLAVALAQDLGKKVFLADCDLRGGNIHQLLSLSLNPGLSDILADGTASEEAFQNSKIANLTILPRGEVPSNPSELLGSKRMKRLLEELRSRFDYIILDSPPSIPITDASILGVQTDGVIFVVQAQKTQARTVRQAQELFEQARAKIIGFTLTHVDYYVPGHYYSYYYHYNKKGTKGEN